MILCVSKVLIHDKTLKATKVVWNPNLKPWKEEEEEEEEERIKLQINFYVMLKFLNSYKRFFIPRPGLHICVFQSCIQ